MSDKKDLLVLLMQNNYQTAEELAGQLSVTSRTIYRWVERLVQDGIPISSATGRSGGILLDENYSVTAEDLLRISTKTRKVPQVKDVVDVSKAEDVKEVIKEVKVLDATWIEIEFSQEEVSKEIDKKFYLCKEAIFTRHVLNFTYHLPQNKILICTTEPVRFFLQDGQWSLLAWIRQVDKFKVFKLSNMTDLQIGPEMHSRIADFSIQEMLKK